MVRGTTALGILALVLSACQPEGPGNGGSGEEEEHGEVVASPLARDTSPEVEPGAQAELVLGLTDFACDLYGEVSAGDDNVFLSPYSISVAMAMTYAGARGETERQMAEAMHFTLPQEELHPALNWLDLELESRGEGAAGMDGGPFRLGIANAIWGRIGRELVPEYLDLIAVSYGSGLRLLDFAADPEGSRRTINDWVSDETEGRIEDLLPSGSITPDTALVLTNAIYFNAAWRTAFDPDDSYDGAFTPSSGDPVTTNLMTVTEELRYVDADGVRAIELPYDGEELAMLIVLPPEGGLEAFEADLDAEVLAALLAGMSTTEVAFTMPSVTFTREYPLEDALSALGMVDAFGAADFTGMDPYGSMAISEVYHKAFVAVSEEGTEAAAATGVVMEDTAVEEPLLMVVDRPFLFLIRDVATGAILFMGRVADPTVG